MYRVIPTNVNSMGPPFVKDKVVFYSVAPLGGATPRLSDGPASQLLSYPAGGLATLDPRLVYIIALIMKKKQILFFFKLGR